MTGGLHFAKALLPTGWAADVRIALADGLISSVETNAPPRAGDTREAIGLPGLPNLHSHAFQRGMAGLAERRGAGRDSFWTWREIMYRFVERLDPDDLLAIAAMAFAEMLEGGFTRVGEFHYLHHDRTGGRFANPAMMSDAIVAAAQETGIALTHLPVFYAYADFGGAPALPEQARFVSDLDGFATLLDQLRGHIAQIPDAILGVAPHSLRAVTPDQLRHLAALGAGLPMHIHIAEQLREVEACLAYNGRRPVEQLLDAVPVDQRWCLVHATHAAPAELAAIAKTGATVGLCPITEANLGDGIFPADAFAALGGRYGIGSDSNVRIDATEELRLLEYGQRLRLQSRNVLAGDAGGSTGKSLWSAVLDGGAQALGAPMGLAAGLPADIVSLDASHPSLMARSDDAILDGLVFSAGRSAIKTVWRRGRPVVAQGRHRARDAIAGRYRRTLEKIVG